MSEASTVGGVLAVAQWDWWRLWSAETQVQSLAWNSGLGIRQLWLRSDPGPGNSICGGWPKSKNKNKAVGKLPAYKALCVCMASARSFQRRGQWPDLGRGWWLFQQAIIRNESKLSPPGGAHSTPSPKPIFGNKREMAVVTLWT